LFRTLSLDGELSAFLEVPIRARRRGAFLLNPEKRVKKAVLDLSMMIQRLLGSAEWDATNISLSFPYLALLNYVTGIASIDKARAIQFCILVSEGPNDLRPPRLLISSRFHSV
jgi:hypothetical protein